MKKMLSCKRKNHTICIKFVEGQRDGLFDISKTNISLKEELAVAHNRVSR